MQIPWSDSLMTLDARFGDRAAATDAAGVTLSFAQLNRRAYALAGHLLAAGLAPGEPVATLLPNGLAAVWVTYAVRLAGLAEMPLNAACGPGPGAGGTDRPHLADLRNHGASQGCGVYPRRPLAR